MRFFLLALLSCLLSCATGEESLTQNKEIPPYYRRYIRKDKELIYVVVRMAGNIDVATQDLVSETMRKFDPEIILTKYPPEESFQLEKEFSRCEQGNGCSPVIWSCQAAKPRGIPCLTAMPFHSEIVRDLKKVNISQEEVLFFYSFNSLVGLSKTEKKPLDQLASVIEENKRLLNIASRFDRDEFFRMYKEKMNSRVIRLKKDDTSAVEDGNYLQKIAFAVEESIHRLIIARAEKEFTSHKRIMMIFGPAYYLTHQVYLEDHFSGHVP